MLLRIAFVISVILLSGCAQKIAAGVAAADNEVQGAVANIKAMNDAAAKAYVAVPCAMDVGAYYRVLSPDQQQAVSLLCGGPSETPVTAQDVKRARELLDILKPQPPAQ